MQSCGESCCIARCMNECLEGCFAVGPLEECLDRGANGAVPRNLAEGTKGAEFGTGMQIRLPAVGNSANGPIIAMVVKSFSRKELKLGSQQHTHDEGMQPLSEAVFLPASHFVESALSWNGPDPP